MPRSLPEESKSARCSEMPSSFRGMRLDADASSRQYDTLFVHSLDGMWVFRSYVPLKRSTRAANGTQNVQARGLAGFFTVAHVAQDAR